MLPIHSIASIGMNQKHFLYEKYLNTITGFKIYLEYNFTRKYIHNIIFIMVV